MKKLINKYVNASINNIVYVLRGLKLKLILKITLRTMLRLKRIVLFGSSRGIVFLKRGLTERLKLSNNNYNNSLSLLSLLSLLN